MFIINRLLGFGGGTGGGGTETLFDRTTGTNIGDMTAAGGLAAAFDGNNNQDSATGASSGSGLACYVGKTLGVSRAVSKIVAYGSNNNGFDGVVSGSLKLNLRAKSGAAPANSADGTLLGTTGTFTDIENNTPKTITSSDTSTLYDHVWLEKENNGNNTFVAELEIYVFT